MSVLTRDPVSDRVHKWLGRLPAGWTGGRLFEIADAWTSNVDKHTVEGQPPVRLCNYVDVYKNSSIVGALDFMAASATREQIETFRIRVGDTLITKDSETADDIGIPAFVEYEADDLICGYHLAIVRPDRRKADPKFLYWVLDSDPIARQWSVTAAGVTRVGIRSTDLNKVTIPLPPLDEQRAIAEYLDRETDQIDALVAKQEKLIRLLRERRRSAIEQRLSSVVARRTSIRHLARVVSGSGFPVSEQGRVGEELPFFKVKDLKSTIQGGALDLAEDSVSRGTAKALGASIIPKGSLAFAKVGAALLLGRVGVLPVDGCVDNNMSALVPNPDLDSKFARYVMLTFDFKRFVLPGPVPSLDMDGLREFRVPVLAYQEQRDIAAYLDKETCRIDALIAKAEEHIALAKERRAALITAAVTGQFDVRTAGKAG